MGPVTDRQLVLDTPALIALARLSLLEAVGRDVGPIVVPAAVYDEGTREELPGAETIRHALAMGLFELVPESDQARHRPVTEVQALGAGEMATMEVAAARGGLAVIDDQDARRVAARRGVPVTGTIAVLVRLRQLGAISSLASTLDALEEMGFRATADLHGWAIEAAGESGS